jgi:chromosome segregation ATPase
VDQASAKALAEVTEREAQAQRDIQELRRQLQTKNEEIITLEERHETAREKFLQFREGMRQRLLLEEEARAGGAKESQEIVELRSKVSEQQEQLWQYKKQLTTARQAEEEARAKADEVATRQHVEQLEGRLNRVGQEAERLRQTVTEQQAALSSKDENLRRLENEVARASKAADGQSSEKYNQLISLISDKDKRIQQQETEIQALDRDAGLKIREMRAQLDKYQGMHQHISQLERALKDKDDELQHLQAQRSGAVALSQGAEAKASIRYRAKLIELRTRLLGKLIGNWQFQIKQASFSAWMRAIEAFKMDRILLESDKYMSLDSSIDELLVDSVSKKKARSLASSTSSFEPDQFGSTGSSLASPRLSLSSGGGGSRPSSGNAAQYSSYVV